MASSVLPFSQIFFKYFSLGASEIKITHCRVICIITICIVMNTAISRKVVGEKDHPKMGYLSRHKKDGKITLTLMATKKYTLV